MHPKNAIACCTSHHLPAGLLATALLATLRTEEAAAGPLTTVKAELTANAISDTGEHPVAAFTFAYGAESYGKDGGHVTNFHETAGDYMSQVLLGAGVGKAITTQKATGGHAHNSRAYVPHAAGMTIKPKDGGHIGDDGGDSDFAACYAKKAISGLGNGLGAFAASHSFGLGDDSNGWRGAAVVH
ncbi:MAG: hypothetical protein WCT45_00460 [Candidatus Paceibacterota bacterium]|jgi:hypothetical protein